MPSRRLGYPLFALVSLLGSAVVALGLGVVAGDVSLSGSAASVAVSCWHFVFPRLSTPALLVLGMGSLGIAVVVCALRSAVRQLLDNRRLRPQQTRARIIRVGEQQVLVLDGGSLNAFTAGVLRPRIYLSQGALAALEPHQLNAVVAHEAHHVRRRDPLRLFMARIVVDGLFFLPVLGQLSRQLEALAELAADSAAAEAGGRSALAGALLAFDSAPAGAVGIAPERVDALLGCPAQLPLPVLALTAALLAVAALAAIALQMHGATPDGDRVSATQLIEQLCLVLKALLPLALAAALILRARAARAG
jgi:hypothetical protein